MGSVPAPRTRGGVIVLADQGVAAIERVRNGQRRYHTLPGGQCEAGEDPASAAVREAFEELGLTLQLAGLVAVVKIRASVQYYYLAKTFSGTFGTGTGAELSSPASSEAGTYRAVWLPIEDLEEADLRPRPIAGMLQAAGARRDLLLAYWLREPLTIEETPS